jgi:ParB family chromosome partitioning protein
MYQEQTGVKKPTKSSLAPAYKKIEDTLSSHFGTRVKLQHQKKGNGQIVLEYYSMEELNALLEKMKVTV